MMNVAEKRIALAKIKHRAVQWDIESMISDWWPRDSPTPPAKKYKQFGLTIKRAADDHVEMAFTRYQSFTVGFQPSEDSIPALRKELVEYFEFNDSIGSWGRAIITDMLGGSYPSDSLHALVKSADSLRIAQVHAHCHESINRMRTWKQENNWVERLLIGGLEKEELIQCAERYLARPASDREEKAVHQLVRSLVSLQA